MNAFFRKKIASFWKEEAGILDVAQIAIPLVISTSSHTVMTFCDRIFLSNFDKDALAAAMPAGLTSFMFMTFFFGITGYINSMVAQNLGAGKKQLCALSTWQGIYLALLGGLILLPMIPIGSFIFDIANHGTKIQAFEIEYFSILQKGSVFFLLSSALSGFFSGIGRSRIVMIATLIGTIINIPLDYLLIYGSESLGIPSYGVWGAGFATITGNFVTTLILFYTFLSPRFAEYRFSRFSRIDPQLFKRLLRFGLPSGIELFLSVTSFNIFLMSLGRLGADELTAINIVLSWDMLAFLPQLGLSIGVAAVAGRCLGAQRSDLVSKTIISGFILGIGYATVFSLLFLLIPHVLVRLFGTQLSVDTAGFANIANISEILLRITSVYVIIDSIQVILAGALRGVGDTKFLMWSSILLHWFILALPTAILIHYHMISVYTGWIWFLLFIFLMGTIRMIRYQRGHWRAIDVFS